MKLPRPIDPETIEKIKSYLALGHGVRQTAEKFGVSPSSVMKYRDEDPDGFEQLRTYNKERYINDAWKTLGLLFEAVPLKVPDAPLKEITTSIGIITDKLQLLQGEATTRSENANRNVHSLDDINIEQAKLLVEMYKDAKNE